MSRSNPTDNMPNPAARWFEWDGANGGVRYYDKEAKQTVDVGAEFGFVVLDQLGAVGGWHESSESGIYSNAVRDTRQDVLLVKAFKGGTLAEGLYKEIKDRVNAAGGYFVSHVYIAFKNGDDGMHIGAIKFKGAALSAWMDFCKANRAQLYKKAVEISGFTEGKKGSVKFRVPVFKLRDLSSSTNDIAVGLDQELQQFLTGYLSKTKREQVEAPHDDTPHPADDVRADAHLTDDDIPF